MPDLNDLVPISTIPSLNVGLSSAKLPTMIELMGAPREPLVNNECRNDQASPAVTRLLVTLRMTPNFRLTGIKPAVEAVQAILAKVKDAHPDLIDRLSTEGMICVRHRNTSHGPTNDPSNHSWGTAVDFKLLGGHAPIGTGAVVPRWLAMLVPFFNQAGWYSGIGFDDAMHFEVAEQTIRKWAQDGLLGAAPTGHATGAVADNRPSGGGATTTNPPGFSFGGFFGRLFGTG